jgi:hypothetical protein
MLARLRIAMREGGEGFVPRRLLGTVLADWLLLEKDLATPFAADPVPAGVELATFDDPARPPNLEALSARLDATEVESRLAAGHVCFAVLSHGKPVAAVWARSDAVWLPFVQLLVPLERGDVYLYDSYTHAAERRRGLTTIRRAYSHNELRARGFRRAIAYVLTRNEAGLAAARHAGLRVFERHRWLHVGGVGVEVVDARAGRRAHVLRRGSDRELDVEVGRSAS